MTTTTTTRVRTEDDVKFVIADAIARAKDERGMSYADLEGATNINRTYLIKIMNHKTASVGKLIAIAKALDIEVAVEIRGVK